MLLGIGTHLFEEIQRVRRQAQEAIDEIAARLAAVEGVTRYQTVQTGEINGLAGPHLIFERTNVHIRSGSGGTADTSFPGLGNLVMGYNEEPASPPAGYRAGFHNIVLGPEHTYSDSAGLVAGFRNTVSGSFASVSGGSGNEASGWGSSVSGGDANLASGRSSSISGGFRATTSGNFSSVSGGLEALASGEGSSVAGGASNTASGRGSSVSGGYNRSAMGLYDWRAGGIWETE